jgi:hypothetical protein
MRSVVQSIFLLLKEWSLLNPDAHLFIFRRALQREQAVFELTRPNMHSHRDQNTPAIMGINAQESSSFSRIEWTGEDLHPASSGDVTSSTLFFSRRFLS